MILPTKNSFLLLLFLFIQVSFISQTYNFKNYSKPQGLSQSQVMCATQDHKGNMWFGTNGGGASQFDGNKFITFSENEGMIHNVVFSIIETKNKKLVFGTYRGVSVYNGFYFKNYDEKNGLLNSHVFKVIEKDSAVWIGTEQGVYILKNDKISAFSQDTILNKSSIFSILIDSKKRIWFGTFQNGVICYNPADKSFSHFNQSNGLQENYIFSISESSSKDILVGTLTGVSIINNKNKVSNCNYIPKQSNIGFRSIIVNSNNEEWYGTSSEGLFKYHQNQLINYNFKNGLTNNSIMCLYSDRENNIWIGTDGAGVFKYSGEKFTSFTKQNGLPENYINSMAQDKQGNYWIAFRNMGLIKMNETSSINFRSNQKNNITIPDDNINTLLTSKSGRLWIGTNDGLCYFENEKFTTIKEFGFNNKYILSLFEDSKSNLWIGTTTGLFKFSNGVITNINPFKADAPNSLTILCTAEDKFGHIWIGTENGVIEFDGKKFTTYNQENKFIDKRVISIIADYEKNLWFGTEVGIYHYDYKSFSSLNQKNGLASSAINLLVTDDYKNLYAGTNNGIEKIDLKLYYNKNISITHFGKEDGLVDLECNGNSSLKDNKGKIWIGTINGIEIYNPKEDALNPNEPITRINSLKLFFGTENLNNYITSTDSLTKLPENLILPFNKNHLTFDFIGICHVNSEKVMYQYKLEGLDNDWTPPTSKTEATYSSLPPGTYKFMVKAMNNDGVWNKEPVSYEFIISPPWYKTWWFYTICVITLISGIWIYNFIHTKKLIADKQKLEVQVTERTKELREEKEKVEYINKEVIQQKTIIEHKNIEITDSIKYAKNIQEALLPNLNQIDELFDNSFVLYMPKDIVSGDFYWFAKNGDTRFIAAVDCTGHGVPGAFMSIVGNTLLNEIVNEKKITVPGDILLELHKGVKIALNQNAMEFERRDGMDITLCSFNSNSNKVQYAGANRPLWIYRKNREYELEIIKATKFPIGGLELEENRVYQNHIVDVNEGDCLYLFSDGYADQFGGPKGKKFMLSNLQRTLLENVESPMETQKQKLMSAFMEWKHDAEQIDDVLVIGIKI